MIFLANVHSFCINREKTNQFMYKTDESRKVFGMIKAEGQRCDQFGRELLIFNAKTTLPMKIGQLFRHIEFGMPGNGPTNNVRL